MSIERTWPPEKDSEVRIRASDFKKLGNGVRELKKAGYTREEIKGCNFEDFLKLYPAFEHEGEIPLDGTAGKTYNEKRFEDMPGKGMPYAIEAWVRPCKTIGHGAIVGWGDWGEKNGCNGFRFEGLHKLVNYWSDNDNPADRLEATLDKKKNLADGNWHHVACAWDGNFRRIYVDFKQIAEKESYGIQASNFSTFMVGNVGGDTGEPFRGYENNTGGIKDVFIWHNAEGHKDEDDMKKYAEWLTKCRAEKRSGKVAQVKAKYLVKVKQDWRALRTAPAVMRKDRDVVLEAVKHSGWALKWASQKLQNDHGVALAAVQQNGEALEFVSDTLKGNSDIVIAAVKQNGWALNKAHEKLRADRKIVVEAVRSNGGALKYASEELQVDFRIMMEAEAQKMGIIHPSVI